MKLQVINGGMLSSIQDAGRSQSLRYGVPRSGAMDACALAAANAVLNNPLNSATIEITAGASAFEMLEPGLLAVTGADFGATLNNSRLPLWTACFVHAGDRLVFQSRRADWGARAYLALQGGVDVPLVAGSRSTNILGGFGGLHGRTLRAGDQLLAINTAADPLPIAGRQWPATMRPAYCAEPALRFISGPHSDYFQADALTQLQAEPLRISASSNRMGYRLEGIRLGYAQSASIASLGVIPGVIQVPPDGMPVLLIADAQTTGGYPIIGVVIAADLPLAAQLLPGDSLRFQQTSLEAALDAWRIQASWWQMSVGLQEDVQDLLLVGAM